MEIAIHVALWSAGLLIVVIMAIKLTDCEKDEL